MCLCAHDIGRAAGREVAGGIELAITNEELASAAAITLFDASRFINYWQRSGVLTKISWKTSCAFAGFALAESSKLETNENRSSPGYAPADFKVAFSQRQLFSCLPEFGELSKMCPLILVRESVAGLADIHSRIPVRGN